MFNYAEPGSSALGNAIREVLLEPTYRGKPIRIDRRAQLLLFAASRVQFVSEVLRPTMKKNPDAVFLIDRFTDSTIAYQHYGYGLDFLKIVAPIVNMSACGVRPDMTIWLDVEPMIALACRTENDKNRIEREGMEFHERVYTGYRDMCKADPERWRRVDAHQEAPYVGAAVLEFINELVPGASL